MRTETRTTLLGGTFGLACAAALLFGAAQATAAPAPAAEQARLACTSSTCGTACFNKGYTHWACWNGNCQCSYGPQP